MAPNPRRVRARLDAVYARLPRMACKGLCAEACVGDIDATGPELQAMERAAGRPLAPRPDGMCGYLGAGGRCGVYDDRPLICRGWGAVETMPCPHGCLATDERLLTFAEFFGLMADAMEATGEATKASLLRKMLEDPEAARMGELIARRGQEVAFPCRECGGRAEGHVGQPVRCGCGAVYAVTP